MDQDNKRDKIKPRDINDEKQRRMKLREEENDQQGEERRRRGYGTKLLGQAYEHQLMPNTTSQHWPLQ